MRISCSSWSYHRTVAAGRMDMMGFIDECATLGLDGVELLNLHFAGTSKADLLRLKKACTDRFLAIAMVSAGGHLTTMDDAQREREANDIGRWMDVASFLGAPLVRFFSGAWSELAAGGDVMYRKVVQSIKRVAAMGKERGIVAALENHGGTPVEGLLRLHQDVASPWFAFTLDTGNFPPTSRVGPETYSSIERCAPHAAIVHAKFFNVLTNGQDRDFDWPRIHGLLAGANFRGFLSLEYEGGDADEVAVIRRLMPFLKSLR